MGIDLGGRDVGVAEEFLNDAEISAAHEKMGREGVAEHVGMDLAHVGSLCPMLDDLPHTDAFERPSGAGEEELALIAAIARAFSSD